MTTAQSSPVVSTIQFVRSVAPQAFLLGNMTTQFHEFYWKDPRKLGKLPVHDANHFLVSPHRWCVGVRKVTALSLVDFFPGGVGVTASRSAERRHRFQATATGAAFGMNAVAVHGFLMRCSKFCYFSYHALKVAMPAEDLFGRRSVATGRRGEYDRLSSIPQGFFFFLVGVIS
ncbi:MAG: hypothetical protein OEY28_09335 [Nitrospira sp.]|nr:hypothetical protein [Nitrospira sp.]